MVADTLTEMGVDSAAETIARIVAVVTVVTDEVLAVAVGDEKIVKVAGKVAEMVAVGAVVAAVETATMIAVAVAAMEVTMRTRN